MTANLTATTPHDIRHVRPRCLTAEATRANAIQIANAPSPPATKPSGTRAPPRLGFHLTVRRGPRQTGPANAGISPRSTQPPELVIDSD